MLSTILRLKRRFSSRNHSRRDRNGNCRVRFKLPAKESCEFGPIYGSNLSSQPKSQRYPGVPLLLDVLVSRLEESGLDASGIYRVPGRASCIQEAINFIKENPYEVENLSQHLDMESNSLLSSLIKRYLMGLPRKILDCGSWDSVSEAISKQEAGGHMKVSQILCDIRTKIEENFLMFQKSKDSETVTEPSEDQCRLATLLFVMDHLQRVLEAQDPKIITYESFAICLTPCLFGIEAHCSKVLEIILEYWDWISEDLNKQEGQKSASAMLSDARRRVLRNLRRKFFNTL